MNNEGKTETRDRLEIDYNQWKQMMEELNMIARGQLDRTSCASLETIESITKELSSYSQYSK